MKETRLVRITATRRRILRFAPPAIRAFCPGCARNVETLPQMQAAEALEVNASALDDLIAAGLVHAIPTVSGSLRICRDSLFQ